MASSIRSHALSDVMAYGCTFENCPNPDGLFGTRREWFEHETQFHRREWVCNSGRCKSLVFPDAASMINHLAKQHKDETSGIDPATIAKMCERESTSEQVCPLCFDAFPATPQQVSAQSQQSPSSKTTATYGRNAFRRHLADHIEQVALFILRDPSWRDQYPYQGESSNVGIGDDTNSGEEDDDPRPSSSGGEIPPGPTVMPDAAGHMTSMPGIDDLRQNPGMLL